MRRKRRIVLVLLGLLLVVVGAVAAWRVPPLARIGTGYAAEQTCSCLFVSRRTLQSCRGDLSWLARAIVAVEVSGRRVQARSLGLARATAEFEDGFGCTLVAGSLR